MNKEVHTLKGNINTNISILNWNKGNSSFINKKDTIEYILQQEKPDILTLQELNITDTEDINLLQIQGYNLEIDQLLETHGRSRAGIVIKNTIRYTRLKDIEVKNEPVVWVELTMPGNKKIKIQNYYRQWRELDREGKGLPNTETQKSQNGMNKWSREKLYHYQIQISILIKFLIIRMKYLKVKGSLYQSTECSKNTS